jgi:hypothetical protein
MVNLALILLFCMVLAYVLEPLFRKSIAVSSDINRDQMNFERKKQIVFESLKDLELDYRLNKLDDDEYQKLKAEMIQEGAGLMRQLEEGGNK